MTRDDVFDYIKKEYLTEPEYLWKSFPDYAVMRHVGNRKWFAVIMNVKRGRLGMDEEDAYIDIIVVKCDPAYADELLRRDGFRPGYHMNQRNWVTVLLDNTVADGEITELIDASFILTQIRGHR